MANWQDPSTPLKWIASGIFVLLTIFGFLLVLIKKHIERIRKSEQEKSKLESEYQDELIKESLRIQEHERARIAADLHDDLISRLNRVKLMSEDPKITTLVSETMLLTREISHELAPPMIAEVPLNELVIDLIQPLSEDYDIQFWSNRDSTQELIPLETKLHLFRMIQELMQNILKHAEAEKIKIYLRCSSSHLALMVKDNGKGFPSENLKGLGLKNIELRARSIKGMYRFSSDKSYKTTFVLSAKL